MKFSGRNSTARVANAQGEVFHGRVSSLQANSVPDLVTPQVTHAAQARPSHGAIGKPSPPHGLAEARGQTSRGSASIANYDGHYRFSSVSEGFFTSDEAAQRAIKISGDFLSGSVGHLQMRFNVSRSKNPPTLIVLIGLQPDRYLSFLLWDSCSQPPRWGVSLRPVLRRS